MTCLVIPVADVVTDADRLLGALLDSIHLQQIEKEWPVVVAFDGCQTEFVETITHLYPFIDPVVNRGNRSNFAGNANRGLRRAREHYGQDAVVVNQDCILPSLEVLRHLPGTGISVPTQVSCLGEPPVTPEMLSTLSYLSPKEPSRTPHAKLTGFCMHLSKELMDKIGYFDEYFKATFEDDDICARALLAGFPVEHVDIAVHHYVSRCGSYDGHRLAINLMKYRNKWSIPPEIEHGDFNNWIQKNHKWLEEMKES